MGWGVHDYPSPPEPPTPYCPVCGEECYTIYLRGAEVIGCDKCLLEVNAYEWLDEEMEEQKYRYEQYY